MAIISWITWQPVSNCRPCGWWLSFAWDLGTYESYLSVSLVIGHSDFITVGDWKRRENKELKLARDSLLSWWVLQTNLGFDCYYDENNGSWDDQWDVTTFMSVCVVFYALHGFYQLRPIIPISCPWQGQYKGPTLAYMWEDHWTLQFSEYVVTNISYYTISVWLFLLAWLDGILMVRATMIDQM